MNNGTCPICERLLPTTHGRRVHCSVDCNREAQRRKAQAVRDELRADMACLQCGTSIARRRATKFCSVTCGERFRGRMRPEPLPERECDLPGCDESFLPTGNGLQRCCSDDHVRRLYRIEKAEHIKATRQPWDDRRRDNYHRRRALKKGAATGAPVIRSEIAARDDWMCHICSDAVDPALSYPDPASASLDHVTPLSRGGLHDPTNVRLAHLACNVAKGARMVADKSA